MKLQWFIIYVIVQAELSAITSHLQHPTPDCAILAALIFCAVMLLHVGA